MPAFPTPNPILLTFAVQAGNVELIASDRDDTVVTVLPMNPGKRGDIAAADATTVDATGDRITVVTPKRFNMIGSTDSILLRVELPSGSRVEGDCSYGAVRGRGRLGDVRIKTSYGELAFDDLGAAELRTGGGEIAVGTVTGDARFTVSNGTVRVDVIDGSAFVKSSNGDIVISEITGELEASTSSGNIDVHFPGTVTAVKTAYGKVRIGDAPTGSLRLETSYGEIEVGVPEGTAAWLDVSSGHGFVRSELNTDDGPADTDRTLEVRARAKYGDILIRRPIGRRPGDRRDHRTTDRNGSDS
jgi:hypothetical protein